MFWEKGVGLISVLFISAIISCGSGGGNDNNHASTGGTISGTARFTAVGANAEHHVKLAARYTADDSIVSNVCDLGTAPDTGVAFSLDIDLTKISSPDSNYQIALSMWMDTNDNNIIDNSENIIAVIPNGTCPVFKNAVLCMLSYEGYWCIITSNSDSEPFDEAVKTGANVISGANVDN